MVAAGCVTSSVALVTLHSTLSIKPVHSMAVVVLHLLEAHDIFLLGLLKVLKSLGMERRSSSFLKARSVRMAVDGLHEMGPLTLLRSVRMAVDGLQDH